MTGSDTCKEKKKEASPRAEFGVSCTYALTSALPVTGSKLLFPVLWTGRIGEPRSGVTVSEEYFCLAL
jgi:hypothetical protein